jgi:hypothetical protein
MPLVFASNEASASGHDYDDKTGTSYEYPALYKNRIKEGERFIYYRGVRRRNNRRGPAEYFGYGVVGLIRKSVNDSMWTCEIREYQPFEHPGCVRIVL